MKLETKEVRFSCEVCEYAATTSAYLKKHIKNKQEEVINRSCTKCELALIGRGCRLQSREMAQNDLKVP